MKLKVLFEGALLTMMMTTPEAAAPINARTAALAEIERIRREVKVQEMLKRPFFTHIRRTKMTEEQLRGFFLQYYSIVQTSYQMLAAGILSTPANDIDTIGHLVRFLDTEAGGSPNHVAYYYRWAEFFGVTVADLSQVKPNRKSRAFEETMMNFFRSPDSLIKQAAQFGTEDCAEVLIDGLDRGFKKFPMSTRAYGYLAAHRLLENDEDGHSRWAIDSLALRPDLSARLKEVEQVYRTVYQVFCGVFDGIYEAWKLPEARA